ncbi:kelch repeat and BTB domain-containing protein 4 isoform X2 [Notamacropus eugenii]|uniref:kelch repeat and BTB domain-containing protein 4 isoform X2 n=1 Tax=Notamacropus eugenii TaxID=9315 RepID=UPI003B6728BF
METPEEPGASTEENYFVHYTFRDRSHPGRVARGILQLCLEEELFADVTVAVEGREFRLHRLVLSAQSGFFRTMFTCNLREARHGVIELRDVSEPVFRLLLDYMYHGSVRLRADELQELYEVSDMYQLASLFRECSRFLARTVQAANCLPVMWLADRHSDPELYAAAKLCAQTHLARLRDTDEFLHLPHRLLADILQDGVPRSQNPSEAIETWVNFNKEERESFSESLRSSLKEIGENVHIYLIGKESSRTHSLAVSLRCAGDDSISVSGQNSLCHQITAACKHGGDLYVVGGEENDLDFFTKPSRLIQCFDTESEKCHVKPYLLPFAGHMHAAVHKDLVFIVAEGDSLVCYNPLLESFTRLCLPEAWSSAPSLWKIASCNGNIYVFRDHYKKGDASTYKLDPATSALTVTSGIKVLLTNLQFVLA